MFLYLSIILFTGRRGLAFQRTSQVTWPGGSASSGVCIQRRECIQGGTATWGKVGHTPLGIRQNTVNKQRSVRILLEYILEVSYMVLHGSRLGIWFDLDRPVFVNKIEIVYLVIAVFVQDNDHIDLIHNRLDRLDRYNEKQFVYYC